ncbi:threonine/serine ThrE exporter family protein [Propionibacterium cyclohexanicum]|uniref:threonine/serine ThrE exporter family protein n=1 Tax=Propionibacterium cyclohexanicum TaxID=64702 RepID=UPI002481AB30|nr:threonine/serine exporter family protein [Propionibacterium cyclohexanicum]
MSGDESDGARTNGWDNPDFVDRTEAVVRLGSMLLSAGTGAYRVKHAMARAAMALGMDRHDAAVSLTEIITTTHMGDNFRTVVREVPRVAVDARRIEALETLSRNMPNGCDAFFLESRLDHISRHVKSIWPAWLNVLSAGMACAAFAVLNRFSIEEALVVLIASASGQAVRRTLARREANQFGVAAIAGAVSSLVYLIVSVLCRAQPWLPLHNVDGTGYVAAILFLVPGFPMMTAVLDIARLDFGAGLPRAFYAMAIVLSAGAGAWAICLVFGLEPLPPGYQITGVWWWIAIAVSTFIGICGFAVMFNSTPAMIWRAALAGTLANLTRFALSAAGVPDAAGSFIGGLITGLLAFAFANHNTLPRITLSVPGSVIMVPGAAMYRTLYWFNASNTTQAITFGMDALIGVLALASGLAAARMCTDPGWTIMRWRPSPHAFRTEEGSTLIG